MTYSEFITTTETIRSWLQINVEEHDPINIYRGKTNKWRIVFNYLHSNSAGQISWEPYIVLNDDYLMLLVALKFSDIKIEKC